MRLFRVRKSNDLHQQQQLFLPPESDLQISENVSNTSSSNNNLITCNNAGHNIQCMSNSNGVSATLASAGNAICSENVNSVKINAVTTISNNNTESICSENKNDDILIDVHNQKLTSLANRFEFNTVKMNKKDKTTTLQQYFVTSSGARGRDVHKNGELLYYKIKSYAVG